MQSTFKLIVKNFISLASAELISKLLGVVSTAYLARVILPEGFGVLGFAIAFLSYFNNVIIFGSDIIGVRDLSKDKTKLSTYFSNLTFLRVFIAVVSIIIVILATYIIQFDSITRNIIIIMAISLLQPAISAYYIYQAIERMEFIAIANIIRSILLLSGYLIFVKSEQDIELVAVMFSAVNIVILLIVFFHIHFKIVQFKFSIELKFIRKFVNQSFPLAISAIMISIYYNLDMIMLGFLKTDFDVGMYTAAFKIFMMGVLPFGLIVKVFLPALSKVVNDKPGNLFVLVMKYALILISFGVAIGVVFYLTSDLIITLIYGDIYLNASAALQILSMNIIIVAVNMTFGNPLTVWNKQKMYTMAVTMGALVNVVLNFILIPGYSYIGAALATVLSELLVFIGVVYFFNRTIMKFSAGN